VTDPTDLSPAEASEMYLDKRRPGSTDWTIQTYHYRLKQFVEWCEAQEIGRVAELDGWAIEQFETHRRADLSPVSLKGQMMAVKQLVEYLASIGAVDEDLPEKVNPPKLDKSEEADDTKLDADDAQAALAFFRESPANRGNVQHTVLEVLWNVGCRLSGLRALDVEDYNAEEQYLEFRHRPDSGTPLKNKADSERAVAIPDPVADALDFYLARDRPDKRDDYGRRPLICGRQGRPAATTVRSWVYRATLPCLYSPCPHGRERGTCEWVSRDGASKCPSSRSPHQIRTGSITWQLNRGVPAEVVSERADVSLEVMRRHYDKASDLRAMEDRRREYISDLDIDHE